MTQKFILQEKPNYFPDLVLTLKLDEISDSWLPTGFSAVINIYMYIHEYAYIYTYLYAYLW